MKTLLAYSGGLDTSCILLWLQQHLNHEVTCIYADIGIDEDHKKVEEKARKMGAKDFIYLDLKNEFADEYLVALIRSGARYQNKYLLGTAIARPLIAKKIAQTADQLKVDHIAHGATGKGNDQIRFEQTLSYLVPDINILSPWKTWDFKGREELIQYMSKSGFSYSESSSLYSIDQNLFHTSYEGGEIEDLEQKSEIFSNKSIHHTKPTTNPPSKTLKIGFKSGLATSLNQTEFPVLAELISELNSLATCFSIGWIDLVEDRINGIKSRGIYHTPAGTILYYALDELKAICWDHGLIRLGQQLSVDFADLIYDGKWHTTQSKAIDAFFQSACQNLTGEITLELSKGSIDVTSRKSTFSLYSKALVSFEEDPYQINKLSEGYVKTLCLPSKIRSQSEAPNESQQ